MDGEALYTIIGGLKPMSSGWYSTSLNVSNPKWSELEDVRQITRAFRSGDELSAGVMPFWRVYEEERYLDGYFFHSRSFAEAVRRRSGFFAFYGITPSMSPLSALMAFEVDQTSRRSRAYGWLFGYPDHAVDFFAESEESQRLGGPFVERDFLSIPVYESPTNRFVYAIPKGSEVRAEDRELKEKAEQILAYYKKLRPLYIGDGKPGIAALLRDWFDNGSGQCSSETALRKVFAN